MSKCAYSLIYISQKIATQLEDVSLANYSTQELLTASVSQALKKQTFDTNLKFEKELIDYNVEKIGKSIVEKLKTRTEIVKQYTDSHSGLVQGGLVNFACYLKW